MIVLPEFNPYVFTIAEGIGLRWYGFMYLLGFFIAWLLGRRRLDEVPLTRGQFDDLLTYVALGIIVGGRVGYVCLYQLQMWLQ